MQKRPSSAPLPIPHHKLVLWLGIFTLLLSLSSQMLSVTTAEAQEQAAQQLQSDEGQTDQDNGQQEQDQQQQEQPPQSTIVEIQKYECPEGSDWSQASYEQLAGNCGPNQNPVDISVAGQVQSVFDYGQWGPFDGLRQGVEIGEAERPDYGLPHVFCSSYIPGVSDPFLNYVGTTSFFNWPLQPGESVFCQIFNYKIGQQNGTVILHKYACPDSWDFQDPYAAPFDNLQTLCNEPMNNISFDYEQDGGSRGTLTTGPDGIAKWDQAPTGPFVLREFLPPGYSFGVAHCSYQEASQANFSGNSQPVQMQDAASFAWNMDAGWVLECFWFNIPSDQLQLFKYWCPVDLVDDQSASLSDYPNRCTEQPASQPIWELYQTNPRQEIARLEPNPASPGFAGYHRFEQEREISIWERLPSESGYGTPQVVCTEYQRGFPEGQPYTQPYDPEQGITWTPRKGYYLVCSFFNLPATETDYGQIVIEKYWCPANLAFVNTPTQEDLQVACQEKSQDGVSFELSGPGSEPQPWNPVTPSGGPPASAFWEEVPAGEYKISETGLGNEWSAIVYCHESSGETNGELPSQQEISDGNTIQRTIRAGYVLSCAWFNLPLEGPPPGEGGSYLDFYKYECPLDARYDADKAYYEQNCKPAEGWEFDLQYEGGGSVGTTDSSGYASWSGVPVSQWQATESLPDGYGNPLIFCRYVEWPEGVELNSDWNQYEAPGGVYTSDFKYEGMRYECHWYNFGPGDTGSYIDFYKYQCPADAPRDADQSYYEQNCKPVEGWKFDLQYDGGGSSTATDSSGYASWSGVPVGLWQATETLPEGYTDPIIWCRYVEWPEGVELNSDWNQYEAPGGVYSSDFKYEGMRYECYWYNFGDEVTPGDQGTNWITIYKYLCGPEVEPGSDLAAMQQQCTDTHSGVPFALATTGGEVLSEQSTSGGVAEWQGLSSGQYDVVERGLPGRTVPLIWCGAAIVNGVVEATADGGFTAVDGSEATARINLDGQNIRYVCYWFNFPNPESTVTVYKYNCDFAPPGYQTLGEWQTACSTPGNGRTFTLTDSNVASSQVVTADGSANWDNVPTGDFTLSELIEPGWVEPVVWCGWSAFYEGAVYDAFPQQVPTASGSYQGNIQFPGTSYFCYWFNIPVDYSSITIYKYDCPDGRIEGVVPDPLLAYQQQCSSSGDGIEFALESSSGISNATTLGGSVSWSDVPSGPFMVTETVPAGYDPPIWFCAFTGFQDGAIADGFTTLIQPTNVLSGSIDFDVTKYVCWVFNFPTPDRTVEVYKWLCPEDFAGSSYNDWASNCTIPMDGVKFTFSDDNGSRSQTTTAGKATWYGGSQSDATLREHIPPGYFEPVFYCSLEAVNGAAIAEDFTEYPSTDGQIGRSLDYSQYRWVCHVYNLPKGHGEITINKWLCPPGYDFYGWGADPKVDCIERWNGITFTLDQPIGPSLQSATGDSIDGAVYFGSLDPGTYVVRETVPSNVDHVFVLDCTGSDIDKVHPYPLQWGSVLNVSVAGGDSIVCNWYNVPRPEFGWITVNKYQCWTTQFVSKVDCQLFEHGASFELFAVPGNTSYGLGTTNAGGLYTWQGLPAGTYRVDEISHTPCKVTTTNTDGQGNVLVTVGQGTIVNVYNCQPKIPPPPGKPPGKYPNTGVGPAAAVVPAADLQDDEESAEGTPSPEDEDFFRISCLDEPLAAATPETDSEAAAETDSTTGATGTEEAEEFDLPIGDSEDVENAEAEGTPAAEDECPRGALPERVVIDAAQVDAGVETLEVVDGIMLQPTGSELVTWYKETARLGESNNMVIAGHLNYWNTPQAVFFYLDQLREGDRIEITGDDGRVYVFEIEWVRQESNLEPPAADVIGPTDEASLTLITCGGTWDPSISEYNERTVARALLVDTVEREPASN